MFKLLYFSPLTLLLLSCFHTEPVNQTAPYVNTMPVNSNFNIQLPENHTTGYIWQLSNAYNTETVEYVNAVWHGNEKGIVFNFEGKNKGKTELLFRLIKYQDTAEVKTFVIEVK